MQDQLVVLVALASGTSRFLCGEPTLHTRTAIAVAEQLSAARFSLSRQEGGTCLVECTGAGILAGQ
jgi:RNA 3'-terminal phosphate cyclase (ATP)